MRYRPLLLLLISLLAAPANCRRQADHRLKVVVSTTLISAILEAVAGDRVAVTTVAPAGLCPGHFDIPPAAIAAASQARLLVNHGWEEWFPKLSEAVTNTAAVRVTVNTKGNWMVPTTHAAAVTELTELLKQVDPAGAAVYEAGRQRYLARIDTAVSEVRRLIAGRRLARVLASDKQAEFLRWLGFDVVAVYGRAEDLTARELSRLAAIAVDSGVGLFVDNLQSGPDVGRPLAEAVKARHVTISNFPLTGSYPDQLLTNVHALLDALNPDSVSSPVN